jgi:hypothetical protein
MLLLLLLLALRRVDWRRSLKLRQLLLLLYGHGLHLLHPLLSL